MTDLTGLKSALEAKLRSGVTLSKVFFDDLSLTANLDGLVQRALFPDDVNGKLVIQATGAFDLAPDTPSTKLTLTPKDRIHAINVVGIPDTEVSEVVFDLTGVQVGFVVVFNPGASWSFSKSFPVPSGFPGALLPLAEARLFFATGSWPFPWHSSDLTLEPGLNFVADVKIQEGNPLHGVLSTLKALLPKGSIVLSGSIRPAAGQSKTFTYPDLELAATLPAASLDIAHFLTFSRPRIGVQLLLGLRPVYFLAVDLKLGDNLSELYAAISEGKNYVLQLALVPRNAEKPITLDDVLALRSDGGPVGSGWSGAMAGGFFEEAAGTFGLYHFGATLAISGSPSLLNIEVGVGTTHPLTVVDNLVLQRVDVRWVCRYPTQAPSHMFALDAELAVGGSIFDLQASHQPGQRGWTFGGEARDLGSLSDLLAKIGSAFGVTLPAPSLPGSDGTLEDVRVTFNTFTRDFTFSARADFGKDSSARLDFAVQHQLVGKPRTQVQGLLSIHPETPQELNCELAMARSDKGGTNFVALYDRGQSPPALNLGTLLGAILEDPPAGLDKLSLEVCYALFGVHRDANPESPSQYVAAVDMGLGVDLSGLANLPLIGGALSAARTLRLAFQVIYASFSAKDVTELNALIEVAGPRFPDQVTAGLTLKTKLRLGDELIDLALPVKLDGTSGQLGQGSGSITSNTPGQAVPTNGGQPDGVTWFRIQKSFGPLHFERIGLRYDSGSGSLTGLLDGSLSVFGLELSLLGLSVAVKLQGLTSFQPTFGLHGLGLEYAQGPIEIGGALFRDPGNDNAFAGLALIRAGAFSLGAIGAFAETEGQPSLFVYAVLDYPLGGPSFFFVTGLAAGFGYNRSLRVPPISQVATFPLVAEAVSPNPQSMPADPASAQTYVANALGNLEPYIPPRLGEYFLSAGLRFTSFELLDSFALLTVQFGKQFEVDLLGISTLYVPPEPGENVSPLAEAQLALEACVRPEEGMVLAQGQLTKASYILSPDCRLTGGFAFASWFSGEHEGDFVVSLGGYHPGFRRPSHYPQVPRLGYQWHVNDHLQIKGGMYYALVPHLFMAGGRLEALFEAHVDLDVASAEVHASFVAGADFLVHWKPFQYAGDAYVDISTEATIHFLGTHHVSFDASADLEMWGPPFGGHAHVQVKSVGIKLHFDVDFGDGPLAPSPLSWKQFRDSFLPANDQLTSVAAESGLVRRILQGNITHWVLDPKNLCIVTHSVIPCKQINGAEGGGTDFSIAPMSGDSTFKTLTTNHKIDIQGPSALKDFQLEPVKRTAPVALWGQAQPVDVNDPSLIANTVSGCRIVPTPKPPSFGTQQIDRKQLRYDTSLGKPATWAKLAAFDIPARSGDKPADVWKNEIEGGANGIVDNPTRDGLLQALGFAATAFDYGQPAELDTVYAPLCGKLATS
jgi:hypothetical protein